MQDLTNSIWSEMRTDPFSALIPTAQAAGNQSHEDNALTARGSEPASELASIPGETITHPAPQLDVEDFRDSPVEVDAGGSFVNASSNDDRPSIFSVPSGDVWKRSKETGIPEVNSRNMIKRGQFNQL